jgi:hypothetical protein
LEDGRRHLGQLMEVKITRAGGFTLYGDPATKSVEKLGLTPADPLKNPALDWPDART